MSAALVTISIELDPTAEVGDLGIRAAETVYLVDVTDEIRATTEDAVLSGVISALVRAVEGVTARRRALA